MKKLLFAVLLMFSSVAAAVPISLDYRAVASGNEYGASSIAVVASGVTVTATSNYNPYLDNGAGLGVCKTLTDNAQCSPSSDDNVTAGEWLNLSFSETVEFTSLSFLDANHGANFDRDAMFGLTVDGGTKDYLSLRSSTFLDMVGTSFTFYNDNAFDTNGSQFYIETIAFDSGAGINTVPEPSILALMGLGLLGTVAVRRKQGKGMDC